MYPSTQASNKPVSSHPEAPQLLTRASRPAPRAITLIEMLIGMAITLVMMAAVVNLFANIGSGVRIRRAGMQMSSQLRTVRTRLFNDLAGATAAARPKLPTDDHNDGYLEIIDGVWSDFNPSGLLATGGTPGVDRIDRGTSLVPSSNLPLAPGEVTDGGGLGDKDSVLALTVRSENEPFLGRLPVWKDPDGAGPEPNQWVVTTVESDLAEIVWYLVENPADGSMGEPGMRTLYRRVFLIAPWVTLPALDDNTFFDTSASVQERILTYYRNFDVSAQIYQVQPNGSLGVDPTIPLIPNSLSDLTKRENRFAHSNDLGNPEIPWPYHIDLNVAFVLPHDPTNTDLVSPLRPFGEPFEPQGVEPDRTGEDVMLTDVLAFDLRVFDPGAPLVGAGGVALEPSDAGWQAALQANQPIVGYGAYVSLGWDLNNIYSPPNGAPAPLFQEIHSPGWHPRDPTGVGFGPLNFANYDTWSYHYENDGIDQDLGLDSNAGVDQGTNGLDDVVTYYDSISGSTVSEARYGTDDIGERETWPPYNVPLRSMQARIRIYEPDTRQIRETTVTRSFVPQ